MRRLFIAIVAGTAFIGIAHAQSMNKHDDPKQQSAGTTGAMENAPSNGVAMDPQQVQQQQGKSTKATPGTVGAAPGADTSSQIPKK